VQLERERTLENTFIQVRDDASW